MIHSNNPWNTISSFFTLWLIVSCFPYIVNASQRYPHVLPKCCEPEGSSSSYGITKVSAGGSNGSCGSGGSEFVFLPKKFFPAMSTNENSVELELWNFAEGLQCEEGTADSEILIDLTQLEALTLVTIGRKKALNEVAFSGDNLLASDGKIYGPRHFCISSRRTNLTHLAINTCKQTCSAQSPCIRRCCGGHQSVLTSTPTSATQSLLEFCSSPTLRNESWSPLTSKIFTINNKNTRFYQTKYAPQILGGDGNLTLQGNCALFAFTETPVTLLKNGILKVTLGKKKYWLDKFCIDGINGLPEGNSLEPIREKCEASDAEEIVVVYTCWPEVATPSARTSPPVNADAISLPACSCFTNPPKQPVEIPVRFKAGVPHPLVKITTRNDGESLECPQGYEDFTVTYDSRVKFNFLDGLLFIDGSNYSLSQSQFCIRSVFKNAVTVRTCKGERGSIFIRKIWYHLVPLFLVTVFLCLSPFYYVVSALVYVLRKDKDLVLRCGTVCCYIAMAVDHVWVLFDAIIFNLPREGPIIVLELLHHICNLFAFAWTCVLCFDFWLTITFHNPGQRSMKWLWGYVAFTLTLLVLPFGIVVIKFLIDPKSLLSIVLDYLVFGVKYGLPGINFLLFLATAVTIWVTRHSSDFKHKKKSFLFYSKLFLLVGLDWVLEILCEYFSELGSIFALHFAGVLLILILLHPIFGFFLLVWNEETKRFMEINHPRVKKILQIFAAIGYPVRKCWGLRKRCKRSQQLGTGDGETLQTFICSIDSQVLMREVPNIPT